MSSYQFILAAEIFAIMVNENHEIIGINLCNTEDKLIQFADDTTLTLEGAACSLQASSSTILFLEQYLV